MGSEDYEIFKLLKEERQAEKAKNRQTAAEEFKEASILAARAGLTLTKCDQVRYRLTGPHRSWIKDIYPGNGRVYCPNPKAKGPFLNLPLTWGLVDVVIAAIEALWKEKNDGRSSTSDG